MLIVLFLDSFIRFTGIGLLGILAVMALRERRTWRSAPYLILACLSVSALFAAMAPAALGLSASIRFFIGFLAVPHLIFVWLFALSLFEQDFKLKPWHWVTGLIYSAPLFWINHFGFASVLATTPLLLHTVTLFSLILMSHLVFSTLRGRTDDLLEIRRSARIYFVLAIAFAAVITAIADPLTLDRSVTDRRLIKTLAIWPAIIWGCYWMLTMDRNAINFRERTIAKPVSNDRDLELLQKLEMLMTKEEVYKDPDITIVGLASRLAVTQHRLRAVINQTLGYQNFNEYLNSYRITEVKKIFGDPKCHHLPILTIAMDCGFKSLSPFNKAFRAHAEMTPSEYRRSI